MGLPEASWASGPRLTVCAMITGSRRTRGPGCWSFHETGETDRHCQGTHLAYQWPLTRGKIKHEQEAQLKLWGWFKAAAARAW